MPPPDGVTLPRGDEARALLRRLGVGEPDLSAIVEVGDVRRWHQERGVPDGVLWATLSDRGRHIAAHRRRTGATGLDSGLWFTAHFRGALYEFNPYHLLSGPAGPLVLVRGGRVHAAGEGFRAGDPALGVHIPESGPLTPRACHGQP